MNRGFSAFGSGCVGFLVIATLALAEERLPGGLTLTRATDVLGRAAGISMPDYAVEYGYDAYGRFGSVTSSVSSVTSVVNYSYLPGSDLLTGYTAGNLTRAVAYETNRDLVDTVENKYGATTVSKFDYTNDVLGRRTNREDTGTAFTAAWTNAFGYNLRSEVTSAAMRNGNSSYTFDPIGNRTTVTLPEEPNPIAYTANLLNQYTSVTGRTNPGYDFDGNMTDDGAGLGMAWDGENRLIQTVKNGQTVTYAYDFMSRRVSKTVGGTTHVYVYDGWNLLSETDGATAKRYVWGLDLSQSLQGAGGVGGLLAAITTDNNDLSAIALATADANGNVSEYLNSATGAIASHQEYDAFGRVIQSTGTAPSAFGFSMKYTDTETGLVYYGYRYYEPEMGRWIGRDLVEFETSYGFAINNPPCLFDILGLSSRPASRIQLNNPNWNKENPTRESGVKQIEASRAKLKRFCDNHPNQKECECLVDLIIDAMKKEWTEHYIDQKRSGGKPQVGTKWCWDWAAIYFTAIKNIPDPMGIASVKMEGLQNLSNSQCHWWVILRINGNSAIYDDGYIDGDIAHFGEFPPPKNRVRRGREDFSSIILNDDGSTTPTNYKLRIISAGSLDGLEKQLRVRLDSTTR